MARLTRTPASRALLTIVVVGITAGAAVQFHRMKSGSSHTNTPPLTMSVTSVSPNKTVTPPISSRPNSTAGADSQATNNSATTTVPVAGFAGPLITQTPEGTTTGRLANVVHHPASSTVEQPAVAGNNTADSPAPVVPASAPTPASINSTADVLAAAKTQVASGDYLAARKTLNEALLSGSLSESDTGEVKAALSEVSQTLIFSPKKFPTDPLGGIYTVKIGERLTTIANGYQVPYELLMSLNKITDARKLKFDQKLKVIRGPFHVVITKSKFTMDVYLGAAGGPGSTFVTTYAVGLGTDNSTPTGTWAIKNKISHPAYFPPEGRGGGVMNPDDPKNPLGAYWMGLEGKEGHAVDQQSYGIHGTIDPSSIGKMSSMGCIRLKNEDVGVLYNLLVPAKTVVVVKD